jgi:UDP-N-acetylglucosamine 1-carboxyvinyltransferase
VLAGLVADGETFVAGAKHVDRGYAGFDDALRALGAEVSRTRVADPAYA